MLTKPNLFSNKREDHVVSRDPRLAAYGQTGGSTPSPAGNSASGLAAHPATATAAAADTKAAKGNDNVSANRLLVGPDVKLKGAEILDCDTLVVEGRVEATMDSRVINIAGNGSFSGKVGIDVAEIHGRFDGELTARSQLIIHATGRVSGTIRYGKILIEEGGEISGDIRSLASAESAPTLSQRSPAIDFPKTIAAVAANAS